MKLNFIRFALLTLLLNITLAACKKDKGTDPQTTQPICLTTKVEGSDGYYATYQYDANRRMTSIDYHTPQSPITPEINETVTIERDNQHRIVKLVGARDDTSGDATTFEYDTKGQLVKSTYMNTPNAPSNTPPIVANNRSTVAEYDSRGLVIKVTTSTYYSTYTAAEFYTYEYTNGNMTKRPDGSGGTAATYEYYTDKEANHSEIDLVNPTYELIGSSPSKNLLKRITYGNFVTDYSYEFNEKGFVTKTVVKNIFNGVTNSQSVLTYTYACN